MSPPAHESSIPHLATTQRSAPNQTQSLNSPPLRIVPARHPWAAVGSVLVILVLLAIGHSMLGNPRWGWPVFAHWFFAPAILAGLARTLELTAYGTFFGLLLGTSLALSRLSGSRWLSAFAFGYIWLFRSIPLLVLLLLLNNLGYLYETLQLRLPFGGPLLFSYSTTETIDPFMAAVLGLSLSQAAFSAEVIRGGILSVDSGQLEASAALGLPRWREILRIVLPQAMRSLLPATFNDMVGLLKGTSMVYVLALPELFYTVQVVYRRNLEVIPLLMVATAWYLVIVTLLSLLQAQAERRFARGLRRDSQGHAKAGKPTSRSHVAATLTPNEAAQHATSFSPAAIDIHGLGKSFGNQTVLTDINLHLPAGSVTAIIGPSGAGKSTLLRTINHLERADQGFVMVGGELVGYRRRGNSLYELKDSLIRRRRASIGMVFQHFHLFPHLNVLENLIEAPRALRGRSRHEAEREAMHLLARVGLADKALAYPRQLSGGQQQRVAIARALALQPKVLLFDEPTSALDPERVAEVLKVIEELAHNGHTLVIVTHELNFAHRVADTVIFMDAGRIVESGPPQHLFNHPREPRTAEFLAKAL